MIQLLSGIVSLQLISGFVSLRGFASTKFCCDEFSGNAYLFLESCNRLLFSLFVRCRPYCLVCRYLVNVFTYVGLCSYIVMCSLLLHVCIRPVLTGVNVIAAYSYGAPVYMYLGNAFTYVGIMFLRSQLFNVYIQPSLLYLCRSTVRYLVINEVRNSMQCSGLTANLLLKECFLQHR